MEAYVHRLLRPCLAQEGLAVRLARAQVIEGRLAQPVARALKAVGGVARLAGLELIRPARRLAVVEAIAHLNIAIALGGGGTDAAFMDDQGKA